MFPQHEPEPPCEDHDSESVEDTPPAAAEATEGDPPAAAEATEGEDPHHAST